MNKFHNLILGAAALVAACSCSSTEEITPAGAPKGDIVIRVATQGTEAGSRSGVEAIPGYTLKCVMQLFADDGVAVGTREVMNASTGTAEFVLHAKDIANGATKAAFWAEYTPDDPLTTPKIYNSDDLSNITYSETAFDMADENRIAAMDAFAGLLTTLENGATVTLKRPMIKLNFTPKNPEMAQGAKLLKVTYNAPSGYNVIDGTCDKEAYAAVTYSDDTFDPAQSPWFTNMIFAPSNMAKLDQPVTMQLSGRGDQKITIVKNSIPLDANYTVNASAEITKAETQDITIDVSIDNEFVNDPDRNVEMVLGSYVNARGRATLDPFSAVGIVFYMGAMSGDNIGLYPEKYAGKTIKAYAVAIENITKARAQLNAEVMPAGYAQADNLVNGTQNSATILEGLGESAFNTAWTAWTEEHAMEAGANTTDWYLPARPQMEEWMSMLMVTTNLRNEVIAGSPTGSREFRALFPLNTIFDRDPFQNCMYATCSVNSNGNIQGTSLTATDNGTNGTVKFSQIDVKTKTQSVLGRPMITIFE